MQGIPGITAHELDLGTGILRIDLAPSGRPTMAALATAVRDGGFTLLDVAVRQ